MSVSVKLNRIDLRINEEDKNKLELAAELNHLSLSSYILSIVLKQADYDIKKNEVLLLNNKERDLILSLMEDVIEPNDNLKELLNGNNINKELS